MGAIRISHLRPVLCRRTAVDIHGLTLRDPLSGHGGLRVDLHRCADLGVPHQLLHHLHIIAGLCQQRTIDTAEGVPADLLFNADLAGDRLQDLPAQAVRPHRHLPEPVHPTDMLGRISEMLGRGEDIFARGSESAARSKYAYQ
jgi:hypothetical protein